MLDGHIVVAKLTLDEELVSVGVEELRANRSNMWETGCSTESNDCCRNECSECKDSWIHCCSTAKKNGYQCSSRLPTGLRLEVKSGSRWPGCSIFCCARKGNYDTGATAGTRGNTSSVTKDEKTVARRRSTRKGQSPVTVEAVLTE